MVILIIIFQFIVGSDLFHANKTASFSSGQSFVDVSFSVRDDSIIEQDEVFGVRLVSSPGLNIGTPSSVEFTIIDDDESKNVHNKLL